MSILSWFSSKPTKDAAHLEKVGIEPVMEIPVDEMQEIFDVAVKKIAKQRVRKLVHQDIMVMIHGQDAVDQYGAAYEIYGDKNIIDIKDEIKKNFPLVKFRYDYGIHLKAPKVDIRDLTEHLADKYVEEAFRDAQKPSIDLTKPTA